MVQIVRRYYLTYSFHIILAFIIILLPFFFLYPLFRMGGWGIFFFFLMLLVGVFYALRQSIIYFMNGLVITRDRIIDFDQKGLFNRVVSESSYGKIQDISFKIKGIWQTVFNYGDIEIQTAASQANLEIKDVAEPQKIQDLIVKIQQETAKPPEDLSAQELVTMVTKIKKGLGEEKFQELVRSNTETKPKKPKKRIAKE